MIRLNRSAYEQLIEEDVAWCEQQPRTLERDHVILVLRASVDYEYNAEGDPRDDEAAILRARVAELEAALAAAQEANRRARLALEDIASGRTCGDKSWSREGVVQCLNRPGGDVGACGGCFACAAHAWVRGVESDLADARALAEAWKAAAIQVAEDASKRWHERFDAYPSTQGDRTVHHDRYEGGWRAADSIAAQLRAIPAPEPVK